MDVKDQSLIQQYLDQDRELKALWESHRRYEEQLKKMETKPFLNSEEKIEKKRLQLAKLTGRTRIEEILSKYR